MKCCCAFLGLRCGYAATDSNWQRRFGKPSARGGPPAVAIRLGNCSSPYGSERLWASPTVSHTGDGRERGHRLQKNTASGLVRRGCPKPFWPVRCRPTEGAGRLPKRTAVAGQPVVRFDHTYSCMMVGFYEPRTMNHEPLFSRAEGHSRRCSQFEFVAAQRHLSQKNSCLLIKRDNYFLNRIQSFSYLNFFGFAEIELFSSFNRCILRVDDWSNDFI